MSRFFQIWVHGVSGYTAEAERRMCAVRYGIGSGGSCVGSRGPSSGGNSGILGSLSCRRRPNGGRRPNGRRWRGRPKGGRPMGGRLKGGVAV